MTTGTVVCELNLEQFSRTLSISHHIQDIVNKFVHDQSRDGLKFCRHFHQNHVIPTLTSSKSISKDQSTAIVGAPDKNVISAGLYTGDVIEFLKGSNQILRPIDGRQTCQPT